MVAFGELDPVASVISSPAPAKNNGSPSHETLGLLLLSIKM
jgi:hypothetical protein